MLTMIILCPRKPPLNGTLLAAIYPLACQWAVAARQRPLGPISELAASLAGVVVLWRDAMPLAAPLAAAAMQTARPLITALLAMVRIAPGNVPRAS